MKKTYKASCHCGEVVIEADLDLSQSSFRCNCSICRRSRFWPAIAVPEGLRIISGEGELTRYVFASQKNHHYFCRRCGIRVFGVGNETPIGKMYGVNIGCLEGVTEEELSRIPITYVDGMHDRPDCTPAYFQHL
jgi:hypothetical protein